MYLIILSPCFFFTGFTHHHDWSVVNTTGLRTSFPHLEACLAKPNTPLWCSKCFVQTICPFHTCSAMTPASQYDFNDKNNRELWINHKTLGMSTKTAVLNLTDENVKCYFMRYTRDYRTTWGGSLNCGSRETGNISGFECATFSNCGAPWNWESAHDKYASDRQHISADGSTLPYLRPHGSGTWIFTESHSLSKQSGLQECFSFIEVQQHQHLFWHESYCVCRDYNQHLFGISWAQITKNKEPTVLLTYHLV